MVSPMEPQRIRLRPSHRHALRRGGKTAATLTELIVKKIKLLKTVIFSHPKKLHAKWIKHENARLII